MTGVASAEPGARADLVTPLPAPEGVLADSAVDGERARDRWAPGKTRRMDPCRRLLAAVLVLATLELALVGEVAGLPGLRQVALTLFLLGLVGVSPCLFALRDAPVAHFVLFALTTSLGATAAIGFVMAELGVWRPLPVLIGVVVATVTALGLSARRDLVALAGSRWRAPTADSLLAPLASVQATLVAICDAALRSTVPGPGGLLTEVGPVWYLAVLALLGLLVWAWASGRSVAAPVLSLATVVVASQAVLYGGPTVMSAARHVGVVEYIRVNEVLRPDLDIYQAWAALFAGTAWLSDVAGIDDVMVLATFWPVLLSPALALGVRVLAGQFGMSDRRAWLAGLLFILANTLNIVYYAPQSVGLLLALTVFVLAVTPEGRPLGARRTAVILLLSAVAAVTHQISPFLAAAAVAALCLFRLSRPWWLPVLVAGPGALWAVVNREVLGGYVLLSAFGRFGQNLSPPEHPTAVAGIPAVTRLAFAVPAAVLVVVGLLALVALLRERDRTAWGLAAAAASPASLVLVTDYGQEGVFRVALFALPWLTVLALRQSSPVGRRLGPAALALSAGILFAVNAFGQTALDWARVVRPDGAEVVRWFERAAPEGAVLLQVSTGSASPIKITERYAEVQYANRTTFDEQAPAVGVAYDPVADVARLTDRFVEQTPGQAHYLLVSEAQGGYDDRYGHQRYADFVRMQEAVEASPRWQAVIRGETTTLYRLREETAPAAQGEEAS